jgi:hypothetical protein
LRFGFTLHTAWLPKIAKRTATYNIPVEEDYKDLVAQQPAEIQELFEKEIYPHFKSKKSLSLKSDKDRLTSSRASAHGDS